MTQLIFLVIGLFIIFFSLLWLGITFMLSRFGWSDLASRFQYDEEFQGTYVGTITTMINWVNYRNIIELQYNSYGLYLRPFILFRLFSKPLLIPWTEIKEVRERNMLFVNYKELIVGSPRIAVLRMSANAFNRIQVLQ